MYISLSKYYVSKSISVMMKSCEVTLNAHDGMKRAAGSVGVRGSLSVIVRPTIQEHEGHVSPYLP